MAKRTPENLVRDTRRRLELSQAQLGYLLGQQYQTIARWERNDHAPPYYARILRELRKLDAIQAASIKARLGANTLALTEKQERGALALLWIGKAAIDASGAA